MRVYVISTGRPGCVKELNAKLPMTDIVYVVKRDEVGQYQDAGADNVIHAKGLVGARNLAIEHSQDYGEACCQISDDIKKVVRNKNHFDGQGDEVDLIHALRYLEVQWTLSGVDLLGVAPTDNHFFAMDKTVSNRFIIGDLFIVNNRTGIMFNPEMTLKEDYWFTLAHIQERRKVLRDHTFLFTFQHYTNPGGAVDVRNAKEEAKNIAIIKRDYPAWVKDNPKRPNEILLRNHLIDKHVQGQESLF